MHDREAFDDDMAPDDQASFHPSSAMDLAGPSHASNSNRMHDDEDRREMSTSPDLMVVGGENGELFGPLQQLRARLAQPPLDDTLSAVLLCTNGDVPAALRMLSESGMKVLPDPTDDASAGAGPSSHPHMHTDVENAHHSNRNERDRRQGGHAEADMHANAQEEAVMLVWLWRPQPLAYWVAGEVLQVDMEDGEPKLTINTHEGVIGDVEQGLLWPRNRGEAPPAPLDEEPEHEEKGAGGEWTISYQGSLLSEAENDASAGRRNGGRRQGGGGGGTGVHTGSVAPAEPAVLTIPLPPEEGDENLSRCGIPKTESLATIAFFHFMHERTTLN